MIAAAQNSTEWIVAVIRRRFVLRWTLANMLGWSLGLYLATLGMMLIGGIPGLLVAGAIAGTVAGAMQWLAMYDVVVTDARRWILLSAAGGTLGALPVLLTGFTLIAGRGIGFAVMGAVFGLCFGWVQILALRRSSDATLIWILANIPAASCCAVFTFAWIPLPLPILCTPGPVIFGMFTGFALAGLLRSGEVDIRGDDE